MRVTSVSLPLLTPRFACFTYGTCGDWRFTAFFFVYIRTYSSRVAPTIATTVSCKCLNRHPWLACSNPHVHFTGCSVFEGRHRLKATTSQNPGEPLSNDSSAEKKLGPACFDPLKLVSCLGSLSIPDTAVNADSRNSRMPDPQKNSTAAETKYRNI